MKRTKEGSKQLFRARISLLVASCFILTLILSSVTVFAVETNKKKTALQKTLGATLVACITTDNAYNIPAFHRGVTGANAKSRDIFTGDLWSVSGYFREIWEGLPDWSMVGVDPIVQLVVDGKYTDGKIGCSNELMNTAMSSLGVYDDYEELICGADGTGGIMVTSNEKTCIANLREGTGEFKPNPDTAARKSHAYKLLSKNVGNLATDLVELYYNPDVVVNSNVIQTNTNQQNPVVVRLEPRNSQSNTLVVPHAPAQSNSTSQRSARQNIENKARNINPNDRRRPPLS